MFGRRNPDQPLDAPRQPPQESDLDLDMLDELPEAPVAGREARPASPPEEPQADPAWHTATPSILGSSVSRLLQEAEAAGRAMPPAPPAPAAAITQRLPIEEPAPRAPAPVQPQPAPKGEPNSAPTRARAIAESVIGPDDFFDGRYRSERGVRIQGNARGSIESRQYIYVEAGAQVEADLSAEDITVSGDFRGKIACRRRLEVTGSGKISGHVQTALLVVQEGGALDGELHMRGPEQDAEPAQG